MSLIGDSGTGGGGGGEGLTPAQEIKLNSIQFEATKNQADAHLLARENHTGTQQVSTVSGLQLQLDQLAEQGMTAAELARLVAVEDTLPLKADLEGGKLALNQLPDIAAGRKITVADENARLALAAWPDLTIAYQSDNGNAYAIDANSDPSLAVNWSLLGSGVATGVTAFNSRAGTVESQSGDYTAEQITESAAKQFASAAQKAEWTAKETPEGAQAKATAALIAANDYADDTFVPLVQKGLPDGVATLDATGKVPLVQLPENIGGGVEEAPIDDRQYARKNASWVEVEAEVSDIRKPTILSPLTGSVDVITTPTLEANEYANIYGTARDYREFQVDISSGDFSVPVWSTQVNADTATIDTHLDHTAEYKWRCRDVAADGTVGSWSDIAVFATVAIFVNTPTLTVEGAPSDVSETPTLTSSAFGVTNGTDVHASTDWRVRQGGTIVWQSSNNTVNKLSIVVPAETLLENTTYVFEVRHNGTNFGSSDWASVTASTKTEFFVSGPLSAGEPFGGGYYAGANIVVDGVEYALVVAPRSQGGLSSERLRWKFENTTTTGTDSLNDGLANSNAMNSTDHPAAHFCRGLSINGHTDWYLPSRDELEICYRYLKPTTATTSTSTSNPDGPGVNNNSNPVGTAYTTGDPAQTSVAIFQAGGGEDFRLDSTTYYWSSSQFSATNAWFQNFSNGGQINYNKTYTAWVRAVRKVAV